MNATVHPETKPPTDPRSAIQAALENAGTTAAAPAMQDHKNSADNLPHYTKPTEPSIGEKWWGRLNYGAVGYAANLAVSVVLWDYFVKRGGKPVYDAIQRTTGSESIAKYIFSPLGGHLTMIPVKIMEDHAGYISHKLNKMLDPNYQHKDLDIKWSDPDEKAPPLSNPPNKNSWLQVYARRGIGWVAVVGAGMGLRASGLEGPLEKGTLKAFDKVIDLTGSQGLKALSKTPRFQSYAQLTALDAYLTVVTSMITAATKNTFGQSRSGLPDDALSVDIPGVTEDKNHGKSFSAGMKPHSGSFTELAPARQEVKPMKNFDNFQELAHKDGPGEHHLSH